MNDIIHRPTAADVSRLTGVHPKLAAAIKDILAEMAAEGCPMFVIEGVRTTERQQQLYALGRTKPGPSASPQRPLGRTVTNCDGVQRKSRHQVRDSDGWGHAVDCAFVDDPATKETETWSEAMPWARYGEKLTRRGITWGGHWVMVDRPHAELRES